VQQAAAGYTGGTMVWLQQNNTTTQGSTINTGFLDGDPIGQAVQALIRFDNLFGAGAGQVSPSANIVKAFLTFTTATKTESFQTRSTGPYNEHQMLVNYSFDGTSTPYLYSGF